MRTLNKKEKELRLRSLEQELMGAANGPKIIVSVSEIRRKGLITVLRERKRRLKSNIAYSRKMS